MSSYNRGVLKEITFSVIRVGGRFPAGRAFATRFPAEKAGRAQTMAQSLTQKVLIPQYKMLFHLPGFKEDDTELK